MVTTQRIGVLALQGGFARHIEKLHALGIHTAEVRTERDLGSCSALIIPGGESTVFTKFLTSPEGKPNSFHSALSSFTRTHAVMGTCAGLILLSQNCSDARVTPLGVLPVTVRRNGWGRQRESFIAPVHITFEGTAQKNTAPFEAVFIRAPRITSTDPDVSILASVPGSAGQPEPVMVASENILGLTFHPELTSEDTRIHEYFLALQH